MNATDQLLQRDKRGLKLFDLDEQDSGRQQRHRENALAATVALSSRCQCRILDYPPRYTGGVQCNLSLNFKLFISAKQCAAKSVGNLASTSHWPLEPGLGKEIILDH